MENRKWGVRIMEAKKYRRIFTIVVDSCGIGGAKDAERFGDAGTDTLGHIAETVGNLSIPNMQKLGIANLKELKNIAPVEKPMGYFTRLSEASNGKDTMTGHWEMMGLHITKPFLTFTEHGFPKELIDELEKRTGHKVIGNKSASGTEILEELGEEEIAREITMKDEWKVGRVIARPYVGKKKGEFVRTSNRHDYALKPYGRTALNALKDAGYDVISVGKIRDIFDGEGITESNKSKSSVHGMEQTIEIAERDFTGLCFVNLVDFDALWGHRRNVKGYAEELERFDVKLGELLKVLREDDLLIITADHGNDPTYKGTDHTREQVMFVAYSPSMKESGKLEDQDTFAVIGATIADNFGVQMPEGTIGTSLLAELK